MAEGRGTVLLEEEMPDPREAVAAGQRGEQPCAVARRDRRGDQRQHAAAAEEVQAPRRAVGVLGQVERIELAEAGEAAHAMPPWRRAPVRRARRSWPAPSMPP